jgi:DNA repair protein RecN (Recombination protein N)
MLKHLSIHNYVIIEELELSIKEGFTVITGETGAGKSILLGALSLILGQRADTSVLNNKEKKCIIEGEFDFDKERYISFFDKHELDYESSNIIRREISAKGKSRAFINDTPVSLTILKELTGQLIDIHSQHQTLQVQDSKFQIGVLDAFVGIDKPLYSYRNKYDAYLLVNKELKELTEKANKAKADVDYISFQVKEIEDLNLKPNEKEKIEAELELINNAEEIKSVLESSENALVNSDKSLLSELKNILNSFTKINKCSPVYNSIYERLNSVVLELEDVATEVEQCNGNLNFNPENLSHLNDRIGKIFSIEQKHNVSSTQEILDLLSSLSLSLSDINSYEAQVIQLSEKVTGQHIDLMKQAELISKKRVAGFDDLCIEVTRNLSHLGMADAEFKVQHQKLTELNFNGIDEITFMFSANKGVGLQELKKAASGGELSRLMLTIKSILAKNNKLSSIVFEEIDTGVSGDIADKMASIMRQMSTKMQVLSITHLPQVAAKGEHHFKIYKENVDDKTVTSLIVLDKTERIEELAKMLSGEKMSDAAKENAIALLNL